MLCWVMAAPRGFTVRRCPSVFPFGPLLARRFQTHPSLNRFSHAFLTPPTDGMCGKTEVLYRVVTAVVLYPLGI